MYCNVCSNEKPAKSFPIRGGPRKDGSRKRSEICRSCTRLNNLANGLCKCGRKLKTKTLCETCAERVRKHSAKKGKELKDRIIITYGCRCVFCGESRIVFLTIDHIDGNGAEHRRQEKISTGSKTYRWLEKNGYPAGFQVACFNCNAAKAQIGEDALRELLAIDSIADGRVLGRGS